MESQTSLSLESLQVDGNEALPRGWALSGSAAAGTVQSTVGLRVGRPAPILATLSKPGSATAACTLEPRPRGECFVRANFVSPTELRCGFECKTNQPKQ